MPTALPADPFAELSGLVPDRLAFRVLRGYCEKRLHEGATVAEAAMVVAARVRRGELKAVIAEAAKPDAIWREERLLGELVKRAVRPYAGHKPTPATLDTIRAVVEHTCAARYPKQSARYVRRVVRAAVANTLLRLEIRVPLLVASLSGIRP